MRAREQRALNPWLLSSRTQHSSPLAAQLRDGCQIRLRRWLTQFTRITGHDRLELQSSRFDEDRCRCRRCAGHQSIRDIGMREGCEVGNVVRQWRALAKALTSPFLLSVAGVRTKSVSDAEGPSASRTRHHPARRRPAAEAARTAPAQDRAAHSPQRTPPHGSMSCPTRRRRDRRGCLCARKRANKDRSSAGGLDRKGGGLDRKRGLSAMKYGTCPRHNPRCSLPGTRNPRSGGQYFPEANWTTAHRTGNAIPMATSPKRRHP